MKAAPKTPQPAVCSDVAAPVAVLDDELAVALEDPEEEVEVEAEVLCAEPSACDRLATRVPADPEKGEAVTSVLLAQELGSFLVMDEENVMSAHLT